jgi:hypothetical protein
MNTNMNRKTSAHSTEMFTTVEEPEYSLSVSTNAPRDIVAAVTGWTPSGTPTPTAWIHVDETGTVYGAGWDLFQTCPALREGYPHPVTVFRDAAKMNPRRAAYFASTRQPSPTPSSPTSSSPSSLPPLSPSSSFYSSSASCSSSSASSSSLCHGGDRFKPLATLGDALDEFAMRATLGDALDEFAIRAIRGLLRGFDALFSS